MFVCLSVLVVNENANLNNDKLRDADRVSLFFPTTVVISVITTDCTYM